MRALFCFLLMLPAALQGAEAANEARAWLDRMVAAVTRLNYEGTFVYVHDDQIEAMQIIHRADENGEQERLISLTGTAREVIRDNDFLTCILPDSRSVVVEKSRPRQYLPAGLLNGSDGLSQNYDFRLLKRDRMTGREAQILSIEPRDQYRYGHRLWLALESGMLLKSDLLDERGTPIEQVMFTSLTLRQEIPEAELQPAISGKGYKWFRQENTPRESGDQPRWSVARLPQGFRMSLHAEHEIPPSPGPVEHMVFTDGLSSVSVYIESLGEQKEAFTGKSRMGAVHAYGTVVNGHQVTVVGEVPEITVMTIGESVRYRDTTE